MHLETDGHLTSFAGTSLAYREIAPSGTANASILITHGYAEHGGRYLPFMRRLADAGYRATAFDHRGHGRSEGLAGFILRSSHLVRDIDVFARKLKRDAPAVPVVLFGHSIGGALAIRYAAEPGAAIDGVVTAGMYLKNAEPVSPLLVAAARLLDFFAPALPIRPHDVDHLCRDREVVEAYLADPLVYNGNVRVRTALEIISNHRPVVSAAPKITVPALLLHGTGDRIALADTTNEVFGLLASEKKRVRMYEGLYHELLNEPEGDIVASDIITWLDEEFDLNRP
jgi:acylglycerol lipase